MVHAVRNLEQLGVPSTGKLATRRLLVLPPFPVSGQTREKSGWLAICTDVLQETSHPSRRRKLMLVLSRKVGEQLVIDGRITVTITEVKGNRVKIGISAPPDVRVDRGEVHERIREFECPEHEPAAASA